MRKKSTARVGKTSAGRGVAIGKGTGDAKADAQLNTMEKIDTFNLTGTSYKAHRFQLDRDIVNIFNLIGTQRNTVTKEYVVRRGRKWEKGRKSEFSMPLRSQRAKASL